MLIAPFCYDPQGAIVVSGDGPDLIAVSAVNDEPIWKAFTDGILVGLAVQGEEVVSCDADGSVIWWRRFNGDRLRQVSLDRPVTAFHGGPSGLWALLCPDGVLWMNEEGDFNLARAANVEQLAVSDNGLLYALSFSDGRVEVRNQDDDRVVASLSVGFSGGPLVWLGERSFVAARGHDLFFFEEAEVVSEQEPSEEPDAEPAPPTYEWKKSDQFTAAQPVLFLARSPDGLSIAIGFESEVEVILSESRRSMGQIRLNRELSALCYGPGTWLGVGHGNCTATRVELAQGVVGKTRAGLGRTPRQWTVESSLDWSAYRGAMQHAMAGGGAVATKVEVPSFWSSDDGVGGTKKRSPLIWVGLVAGLISVCCGCCSCSGLITALW